MQKVQSVRGSLVALFSSVSLLRFSDYKKYTTYSLLHRPLPIGWSRPFPRLAQKRGWEAGESLVRGTIYVIALVYGIQITTRS